MRMPGVMSIIFWGLIAFAGALVAFGIYRSQENAAKPRYEVQSPVAAANAATRQLVSPEPFFSFGNISMAAGKVSHRFEIRNTGASDITVNKIYTSCMCTVATLITPAGRKGPFGMPGHSAVPAIFETIPPGGNAQVDVVFDPAAHGPAGVGPTDRIVTIRTNESRPLELRFSVMVRP